MTLPCTQSISRVKCSVTSPLIVPGPAERKGRDMRVEEEDVTDDNTLWGSPITEQSVRKRSRELSQSPEGDSPGRCDTFQKSQSKRGSFEWESSSNAALQKALCTSLCNTRQDTSLSECLERTRPSLHTRLEPRTSQSTRHARLSDPAGFGSTCSPLGAGMSRTVSEPSVMADSQPARLDVTECTTRRPFCSSIQTSDFTHHKPITEEMSSSNTDNLSGVLQRKVRTLRRRRTAPSESLCGPSGKSLESQCLRKDSASQRLSAPALDLWQLFQSSDNMEEDFKGFFN